MIKPSVMPSTMSSPPMSTMCPCCDERVLLRTRVCFYVSLVDTPSAEMQRALGQAQRSARSHGSLNSQSSQNNSESQPSQEYCTDTVLPCGDPWPTPHGAPWSMSHDRLHLAARDSEMSMHDAVSMMAVSKPPVHVQHAKIFV